MMRASMIRSGMSCASSSSPELLSSSLSVLLAARSMTMSLSSDSAKLSAFAAATLVRYIAE